MPPKRRSKTPNVKPVLSSSRTEVSIKWSTENIERLLHLIDSKNKYRLAFFPQGLVKHKVCDVARELCIELQEDDPKYMEMLERRKQVVRKGGKWVPTKTWTSSYNNPVVTKYHDLKKRYTDATVKHCVQSHWTSFKDVPRPLREEFQKSCPWYFTFRKLDAGPRSPPPQTKTLREMTTSERNTTPRGEDDVELPAHTTSVALPAKVVNPFLSLRPMPKRPAFLESLPPAPPTIPRGEQGHSRQAPIEVDSDSDSSSVVEIINHPISKARKLTRNAEEVIPANARSRFRNNYEADKAGLQRIKRQLGVATHLHSEDGTTEPKIFKYIPTERDRHLKADADGREQILRRARTNLLFRVLRDLESFTLPQCLADCGLSIDPVLQKNYSARADQIRRIVKSAGGRVTSSNISLMLTGREVFGSEKRLRDTERAVRIHLLDDGPETKGITRPMDGGDADQDLENRTCNILDLGRFLRRRIFHAKIRNNE